MAAPKVKRFGSQYLKTAAFRRGVVGSSRGWLAVWIVVTGFGLLRKRTGRTENVVYRTELHAGETLLVEHRMLTEEEKAAPKRPRRRDRKPKGG